MGGGGADMPVYLGVSCVKGRRGERRGGGGRVEKEVESRTTLAGVTLEWPEQRQLGETETVHTHKQRGGRGYGQILIASLVSTNCPSNIDTIESGM